MKIAISGKGGVGKTLLSAFLSQIFVENGYSVIAIDADPDANLAATLGFTEPEKITPISEMEDLIEERVGVRPGTSGSFFALNPRVDDLPDRFSVLIDGVRLLVLGTLEAGGKGCMCPMSAAIRACRLDNPSDILIFFFVSLPNFTSRRSHRVIILTYLSMAGKTIRSPTRQTINANAVSTPKWKMG